MPKILLNSTPHPLPDPPTVAGLLVALCRDPKKVAVEVNEEVVPRESHTAVVLNDGDRVEIVTLVGGG
ncbi:MAG: sulfur carrier protein ThiS [Fimbriiglobus sp.]|jgi:thiamine biosynthesis protein ThiS|nr:sulfur carrier protein ThiS [Fimbriiglobus sp.]